MCAQQLGDEQWRPIPGYEPYEASDHGRIRNAATGHVLRGQSSGHKGYVKVHLGRQAQRLVHILVALAWHGEQPDGHQVDHLDWNRTHNHPHNLRWLPAHLNRARQQRVFERGQWVEDPAADPDGWVPTPPHEVAELEAQIAARWG